VPLSIDHNPNAPGERERIVKAGGFVSDPPEEGLSARVWLDRKCTQVGLAMGRSIGDNAVKRIGVIAEPEVRTHEVSDRDDFLIMATDGVWEFIPNEEAIELVGQFFDSGAENAAKDACKSLIDLAVKRWRDIEGDYRDDITAIVMKLATQDPNAAL
jgi:serine/threonine protein phosphatase PrpC